LSVSPVEQHKAIFGPSVLSNQINAVALPSDPTNPMPYRLLSAFMKSFR